MTEKKKSWARCCQCRWQIILMALVLETTHHRVDTGILLLMLSGEGFTLAMVVLYALALGPSTFTQNYLLRSRDKSTVVMAWDV